MSGRVMAAAGPMMTTARFLIISKIAIGGRALQCLREANSAKICSIALTKEISGRTMSAYPKKISAKTTVVYGCHSRKDGLKSATQALQSRSVK